MVGITSGMQDLHRDLAVLGMHRICYLLMLLRLSSSSEFSCEWLYTTNSVRRVTASNNQTNITPGTLGKVGCEAVMFVAVLEPGVHGAHEDSVLERRETEVERGEQVRVLGVAHGR